VAASDAGVVLSFAYPMPFHAGICTSTLKLKVVSDFCQMIEFIRIEETRALHNTKVPQDLSVVGVRRRRPKRLAETNTPQVRETDSTYHPKAVSRTLDVLDSFTDERPELTLKTLSQTIGMPESSLFRILMTLESRGYLIQRPDGAYSLAPKLLLGRSYERAERIRQRVRPLLEALASRFDETASLAYLFEDRIQVLDTVESFHAIRMTNKPGRVLPAHASSLGKAITAFQPRAAVDRILEVYGLVRRTERTVVDRQVLLSEFDQIRARGYAVDREESVTGGVCIGAAITVDGSQVVAAISTSTPIVRISAQRELEITRAVLDSARQAAIHLRAR
jgi:DNA-binding IclR family transcriptional regulator